jgi:hypothetical protein
MEPRHHGVPAREVGEEVGGSDGKGVAVGAGVGEAAALARAVGVTTAVGPGGLASDPHALSAKQTITARAPVVFDRTSASNPSLT